MPSLFAQLAAGRQFTSLRALLSCSKTATTLRQGPPVEAGAAPAWIGFLCPAHVDALPAWPGTAADADGTRQTCGAFLDFRPTEQLLQSHADLWLTPLTGVDPNAFDGVWADVLQQADRVLQARLEERGDAGEDEPLLDLASVLGIACQNAAEGDLHQAAVPLAICETIAGTL
ncbi:hypothetical protein SAMN05216223_13127 [Actinacidiphila yanglinensis]|uniref:Uncharacterized protein n=1 Tax=Actinacidiphila yanglinensis TaxID=310779 RepID=A0A1H6ED42_9ACTN|nr:hypothetical protein [Actinacidiphila yanglinensis]SEG94804.1 hypothetical protein SAMN05216223_13127 [Actinacidiphila yanglinensis]